MIDKTVEHELQYFSIFSSRHNGRKEKERTFLQGGNAYPSCWRPFSKTKRSSETTFQFTKCSAPEGPKTKTK